MLDDKQKKTEQAKEHEKQRYQELKKKKNQMEIGRIECRDLETEID